MWRKSSNRFAIVVLDQLIAINIQSLVRIDSNQNISSIRVDFVFEVTGSVYRKRKEEEGHDQILTAYRNIGWEMKDSIYIFSIE